jgi:hypothetical protein
VHGLRNTGTSSLEVRVFGLPSQAIVSSVASPTAFSVVVSSANYFLLGIAGAKPLTRAAPIAKYL